jgi:hypothetical protein
VSTVACTFCVCFASDFFCHHHHHTHHAHGLFCLQRVLCAHPTPPLPPLLCSISPLCLSDDASDRPSSRATKSLAPRPSTRRHRCSCSPWRGASPAPLALLHLRSPAPAPTLPPRHPSPRNSSRPLLSLPSQSRPAFAQEPTCDLDPAPPFAAILPRSKWRGRTRGVLIPRHDDIPLDALWRRHGNHPSHQCPTLPERYPPPDRQIRGYRH